MSGCGDKYALSLFGAVMCGKLGELAVTANMFKGFNNSEVFDMGRPSKPMAKNSNSKFTTRNNKQDIFSKMGKQTKTKTEQKKHIPQNSQPEADNQF